MVCAPVRSIIPSLRLGDYLSVQAHKACSISHLEKGHVFVKDKITDGVTDHILHGTPCGDTLNLYHVS